MGYIQGVDTLTFSITGTKENALAKKIMMVLGQSPINASDISDFLYVSNTQGNSGIDRIANSYMLGLQGKVGEISLFQTVLKNGTGVDWAVDKATALLNSYKSAGALTWSAILDNLAKDNTADLGIKIDKKVGLALGSIGLHGINDAKVFVSGSMESNFAKLYVMVVGAPVKASDMGDLLYLYNKAGHYGEISSLVNSKMNEISVKLGGDVQALSYVLKNATGTDWSSTSAQKVLSDLKNAGVNDWMSMLADMAINQTGVVKTVFDSLNANIKNYLGAYAAYAPKTDATVVLPVEVTQTFLNPNDPLFAKDVWNGSLADYIIRDNSNKVAAEFHFNAPSYVQSTKGMIFDFSGGDKTLVIDSKTASTKFGIANKNYLLNFDSLGDKIVVLDLTSLQYGNVVLNKGGTIFSDRVKTDAEFTRDGLSLKGAPSDKATVEVVNFLQDYNQTAMDGLPIAAFGNAVPAELATVTRDGYLPGVKYQMDLYGRDGMYDMALTFVGVKDAVLNSSNFIFNAPEYVV